MDRKISSRKVKESEKVIGTFADVLLIRRHQSYVCFPTHGCWALRFFTRLCATLPGDRPLCDEFSALS